MQRKRGKGHSHALAARLHAYILHVQHIYSYRTYIPANKPTNLTNKPTNLTNPTLPYKPTPTHTYTPTLPALHTYYCAVRLGFVFDKLLCAAICIGEFLNVNLF